MAKYIQNTPMPPEYSFKDTMDSWKVMVAKDAPPSR
jgi:nitrite reductase (NO-forming)/hydroxylamine reductase